MKLQDLLKSIEVYVESIIKKYDINTFVIKTSEDKSIINCSNSNDIFDYEKINEYLKEIKKSNITFVSKLYEYMDAKQLSNADLYKKADITRQLFSNIIKGNHPSKKTALSLILALNLPLEQAEELLALSGYCLQKNCKFDIVIYYFLKEEKEYSIDTINSALNNIANDSLRKSNDD